MQDAGVDSSTAGRRPVRRLLIGVLAVAAVAAVVVGIAVRGGVDEEDFLTFTSNAECFVCHADMLPELVKQVVHQPFATEACTSCHTPHGSITTVDGKEERVKGADSQLVAASNELCWTCHGDTARTLSDPFTHAPFAAGRCVECHNPHASDHEALLTQAPEDLCVTCHPIGTEINRDYPHPPAARLGCGDCHAAHGSAYAGMLVASQRDLCFGCHPSVAMRSDMSTQHEPFLDGKCSACHEPHGANVAALLQLPTSELCAGCHPEKMGPAAGGHPVSASGVTCASCHDPHATNYPALAASSGSAECFACHGNAIGGTYTTSAHRDQPCSSCHALHGSTEEALLVADGTTVCLGCHDRVDFGDASMGGLNNHPVGGGRADVNTGGLLTCVSSCHNPHGSTHGYMLRAFDYPQDGNCLICHGVLPAARVGVDF